LNPKLSAVGPKKFNQYSMLLQVISTTDSRWQKYLDTIPHDFYHLPGYLALEAKRHEAIAEAVIITDGESIFFFPYLIRNCYQVLNVSDISEINESAYTREILLEEKNLHSEHSKSTQILLTQRDGDTSLLRSSTMLLETNVERFSEPERSIVNDPPFQFQKQGIYDVISPYGYPGMLANAAGQNFTFIQECWSLLNQYWQSRNICSAFIRLHPIFNEYLDAWDDNIDRSTIVHRSDVVICDLTASADDIWKKIRSNHRSNINKSKRGGATVRIVSVDLYLDIFIDIYQETMQRLNADRSYFFSRSYFEDLVDALGDRMNLCIMEIDNEIIAACLVTECSGVVQYHLSGARTEFLSQAPMTRIIYHVINWAKDRGNKYFSLGGGLGGRQDSLYHFKAGFSKEHKSFRTIRSIVNQNSYDYLTDLRASYLGKSISEIKNSSFFPLYRSL
jgi:Acetyltransferase (GNAT) domain